MKATLTSLQLFVPILAPIVGAAIALFQRAPESMVQP
jgi:glycerol uptake facilitator-like aquaporin